MMTKLLLVDDNDSIRFSLSAVLEEEGYLVETAASFDEASGTVIDRGRSFAVAVLDRYLKDGLGTDLVPIFRAASPQTKLVVLTGAPGEDTLPGNVDAYIGKGGDVEELVSTVKRLMMTA